MNKKLQQVYDVIKDSPYLIDLVDHIRKKRPIIYVAVHRVTSSGMTRYMSAYMVYQNQIVNLNYLIQRLGVARWNNDHELIMGGCGMDMGFALVYAFSHRLFPSGFRYRKGEWHRNNDPSSWDRDGGYALKKEWI